MVGNIFLLQELLRHYGRKRSSPRCMLNVDLRKAFDSIDWDFIRDMLLALNFPLNFIGWIMSCISSTSYSLSYNGSLHGFFKGQRGLRSFGELKNYPDFNFHPRCGGLKITHLAYADDLILLSRGDPTSISLFMDKLNHFREYSGLKISLSKSSFFSAGISATNLETIKAIRGFSQGVRAKITQLCRNFLWSGKCTMNKRPLVALKDASLPKQEGGLGIRNSKAWNKALLSKTLWDIQAKKATLWVQWVHQIYMNRVTFWEYRNKHEDSPT
ncbi:uncharacterized protein LOC130757916 [Actinidia eriantha]|uniref:uncharacterized protein LOC130757916 n=1 Tax=Actinidia eriantha TaxID=165200 RepID=UPI00258A9C41|nr:uncharacterized protein LOC130757916 [Actinidia eriantha]